MTWHPPFRPLPLNRLAAAPRRPETHHGATLTDPAGSVLTDLRHSAIVVADHLDLIDGVGELLMRAGVHMAFVGDVHGEIVGMVTSDHLRGEAPLRRAISSNMHHDELTLEDMMTPIADWATVDATMLDDARVGDVVATLRAHGQRYLFVTEQVEGRRSLRGMFSARRIEEELQSPIAVDHHANSFAELEARIGH
jgi:CBS domain containing-hemolysin-like protein